MKLCLSTFAVLIALNLAAISLSAQNSGPGLSIVPAISEKVVSANQLNILPIKVTNITDKPLAVVVMFTPFAPIDPIVDEQARLRYDASSWLSVDQTELLLEPQETQTVDIRINPPRDAGAGGNYANVVFRIINSEPVNSSDTSTVLRPELTSLLFLTVPGDINELAQAEYSSPWSLSQSRRRDFSLSLTNVGTIHVLPTSSIAIRDLSGQEVANLPLRPNLLIPGTTTTLSASWTDASPGIYRAHYSTGYGSPAKELSHTSNIIVVLPALWIQFVILAVLVLLIRILLPPLFRLLHRKKYRFGQDLTGEPNIQIAREKIEIADTQSKIKDSSKKK